MAERRSSPPSSVMASVRNIRMLTRNKFSVGRRASMAGGEKKTIVFLQEDKGGSSDAGAEALPGVLCDARHVVPPHLRRADRPHSLRHSLLRHHFHPRGHLPSPRSCRKSGFGAAVEDAVVGAGVVAKEVVGDGVEDEVADEDEEEAGWAGGWRTM